jgi:peptide/nickel transport system substrate-binding protein
VPARRATTLAAAAILALVALASAAAQPTAAGKYGGTLYVGTTSGEPGALDPTTGRTVPATLVYNAICRGLYVVNAKNELVPDLATALPTISADKLTYTVPLRKGVVFNDGTPFNAQAVVTTIHRDQTLPGSRWTSDLSYIDSVAAPDPHTVVFHLKSRFSPLPTVIGVPIMSPTQLQKLGTNFSSNPICVGPYMYDNRVEGDSVTVIKSPYYYDKYVAHFDKIVWKYFSDVVAAATALRAGDIQVLPGIDSTQLASIRQDPDLKVITTDALSRFWIRINIGNRRGIGNLPYQNVGTPLASSPKLRQAFEEAINRTTFNKLVFGGLARPGCTFIPYALTAWYGPTDVPCTPYDPADAKKLVAASGIRNPTVHLLTGNQTTVLRAAQFIQAAEAAVGINLVIDTTDLPTGTERSISGNYDAYIISTTADIDPGPNFLSFYTAAGSLNYMGYTNPRLEFVIANSFKATTLKVRQTLYRIAQQIVMNDRPDIVLIHGVTYAGHAANVKLGTTMFDDYVFGQYT